MPDVDLFVRSSGEQRTSNFLVWQSAYAEMVFLDTLWPDFDRRHLWYACEIYAARERRYGGRSAAAGLTAGLPRTVAAARGDQRAVLMATRPRRRGRAAPAADRPRAPTA